MTPPSLSGADDRRARRKRWLEQRPTADLRGIAAQPIYVPLDAEIADVAAEIVREREEASR